MLFPRLKAPLRKWLFLPIRLPLSVFHPDLIITGGEGKGMVEQVTDFFSSSKWAGTIILLIVAVLVGWFITKK